MNKSSSVKVGVHKRTICPDCNHLHRASLRKKCACCGVDVANVEEAGGLVDL